MSTDPRTRQLSETAAQRGPNRPLFTKGGPPNYVEKSLAAAAEPFKGITNDGNVIPGLFGIQKTGVSTRSIRQAAEDFLGSLSAEQRRKTVFPIDTDQWRKWSNIHPTLMRHGTPLFEMSDLQRDHAFALLRGSLSGRGFEEAIDIMHLNETVQEMTGRLDEYGEDLYWLSIMGTPSESEPWGWQRDGHHLIILFRARRQTVVAAADAPAQKVRRIDDSRRDSHPESTERQPSAVDLTSGTDKAGLAALYGPAGNPAMRIPLISVCKLRLAGPC